MRAYYLCGVQHAISNIALRRLKVSRYSDLNDPFEVASVAAKDPKGRDGLKVGKAIMDERFGCLCFSKSWSDPLLWAHYAEKHYGLALGFDIDDDLLETIHYIKDRLPLEIGSKDAKPTVNLEVAGDWMSMKFAGWQYEDEVRASIPLDPSKIQGGLYFTEFSEGLILKEAILGVRCELPIGKVRDLVSTFQPTVSVVKARLANDAFRIEADE
jgi:hypothetical protein